MLTFTHTETFPLPLERYREKLIDFKSFKNYIKTLERVEVEEKEKGISELTAHFTLGSSYFYTLRLDHRETARISWNLITSNFFKSNFGMWELSAPSPEEVSIKYTTNIELRLFYPRFIIRRILKKEVPHTMRAVYESALKAS